MRQSGSGRRRPVLLAVAAVAVVAFAVWGVQRLRFSRSHVSTENAQVDGHIVPVLAKVSGYVQTVAVEENQRVSRGELVIAIDPAELEVRVAEAEADVAAARASAGGAGVSGQVQAESAVARSRREALEARLTAARAQRDRLAKDLARAQDLAAK